MAFNLKLKEIMDSRNMKGADLARSTGLSEAIISEYLKGKKEPRGKQSVLISKALGVSLDELWETGLDIKKEAPAAQQELSDEAVHVARCFDAASHAEQALLRSVVRYIDQLRPTAAPQLERPEQIAAVLDYASSLQDSQTAVRESGQK